MNNSIQKAVEILGSQSALARACGVSQPTVNLWLKGGGISVTLAQKIENATNGQVTVYEIAKGVKQEKENE